MGGTVETDRLPRQGSAIYHSHSRRTGHISQWLDGRGAFFGFAAAERSDPPKYLLKGGKIIAKAKEDKLAVPKNGKWDKSDFWTYCRWRCWATGRAANERDKMKSLALSLLLLSLGLFCLGCQRDSPKEAAPPRPSPPPVPPARTRVKSRLPFPRPRRSPPTLPRPRRRRPTRSPPTLSSRGGEGRPATLA